VTPIDQSLQSRLKISQVSGAAPELKLGFFNFNIDIDLVLSRWQSFSMSTNRKPNSKPNDQHSFAGYAERLLPVLTSSDLQSSVYVGRDRNL
jgi:hypothetical protein